MKNFYIKTIISGLVLLFITNLASAAAVVRTAAGANAAAIQATVDQFRADLGGGLNPNTTSTFPTGRREINWDGVPDASAAPNFLASNFFNVTSPRGVVFSSPCSNQFQVSADSSNPTSTAARFGNVDPSYENSFTTFSAERLFTNGLSGNANNQRPCNVVVIDFFIPGSSIPATVSGFGVVLTDVDLGSGKSILDCLDEKSNPIVGQPITTFNNGLSFVGVSFNAGERISKCFITSGTNRLAAGNVDTASSDIVAMDDFIYGEPHAAEYHAADFDGDGASDFSVFRPATGQWFVMNSGTSTFSATFFGLNGDRPIEGDFDGDSRSDLAVFRPSSNTWFRQNSGDNQFTQTVWGAAGDRPVPGDYDKDGKTDIAIWRPSDGNYYFIRSSNNSFGAFQWGSNGDIPIGTAAQ